MRNGFILFVAVAILPLMLLAVFSYNTFTREEALRTHRISWNDILTKAAEGVGEEAFSWFLANPGNDLAEFLTDPATLPNQQKSVDLTARLRLASRLQGPTVERCLLSVIQPQPFFRTTSLPTGFNSVSQGYLYPDSNERFALLKVEITVSYQRYRRTYEAIREVKAVNLLPGIFGQFTLFVKDKKPGLIGDMNQLKTETETLAPTLAMDGFADPASPLGNPLTLIHHPDDAARISAVPGAGKVSPDWPTSPFDATQRGWVFLGSTQTAPPFHTWIFQPLQGDITPAATKPYAHRFFGGNFLLSNHTVLLYHTKMPSLAALNPSVPPAGVSLSSSPFSDDAGHPFIGWMIIMKRFGFLSATPAALIKCGIGHVLQNYYQDPEHLNESAHGSLILPFGSQYPLSATTIADQRSPTILLGPAGLRFIQTGVISQIDQTADQALTAGQDMVTALENQAANDKPVSFWLPYFPIRGSALVPGKPDSIGWNNHLIWASVGEQGAGNPGAFPGRDWAAINYNVLDHVVGGGQTPPMPTYYGLVMTTLVLNHAMNGCEQILSNNMRGVSNPSGWQVPPASRQLQTLPSTLQAVDTGGNDTTDTADAFFFSDTGRGVSGNRLALKDTTGTRLAVGYLGALWPFSSGSVSPNAPLSFTAYDLRQKTTHLVRSPTEFQQLFVHSENGKTILDLQSGIVTVLGGDVTLKSVTGIINYVRGGMLIVSEGKLIIEAGIQRDSTVPDPTPVTLATARDGDSIVLATSRVVESYLLSSGTLKKTGSGGIHVLGGVAVKFLEFDPADPQGLCRGHPGSVDQRSSIIWNPAFNMFDPQNRSRCRRLHLGSTVSYWKTGVE